MATTEQPILPLSEDEIAVFPIPLPDGGEPRPLDGPGGRQYLTLRSADQAQLLRTQVQALEVEHFGLKRGYSTLPHAVVHAADETREEAYHRFVDERLPLVEAELDRLYTELDAANAGA